MNQKPSESKIETVETNIPGVRAFSAPPHDFDALRASDTELARYGLPPRPDRQTSPVAFASWERWVTASQYRIVPKLKATNVHYGPAKNLSVGKIALSGPTPATSSNWSGFVISDASNIFNLIGGYVQGTFVVPKGLSCVIPTYYDSANWVGVDGWGSDDVFQLGTSTNVDCVHGSEQHYAWIEWYPAPSMIVTNFPVDAGDIITVAAAVTTAQNRYEFHFMNWSTRQSLYMLMTPPSGTQLVGNSIEWVVERPTINGVLSNLTPFFLNSWTGLDGFFQPNTASTLHYRPSVPATGTSLMVTMTDGTNNFSVPSIYPGPYDDSAWFQSLFK
jgi:Peptidase A4 family